MIAIAVDDESWALNELSDNLALEPSVNAVHSFSQSAEALAWAGKNTFDVAFLDINMRGINGIELAKKLKAINSKCHIVFCTGYGEYALDAFSLHAVGYLLKPILPEKLHAEIEYINGMCGNGNKRIIARCYGGFEVYDHAGNPLHFKRTKSKELLAVLIDSNGMGLSSREICGRLFNSEEDDDQTKSLNHLYKLVQELRRVLKEADADNVLKSSSGDYYIDMSQIEFDNTGKEQGKYLEQYHWK